MATITTLIPAYKKEYLPDVFRGLQRQTFRDFEVLLSDDSPGDEITRLVEGGHYGALQQGLRVRCVRGPKNARLNHTALIDLASDRSPFVHLHLDDDVVYPDFYASHLDAHAGGSFSASVSRRWLSQLDTTPVQSTWLPPFVEDSPLRHVPVDAAQLFSTLMPRCANWVGEFTNMLISAEGVRAWPRPPAQALNYYGWLDVGFVLSAVQRAPLVFVREHLSVFRQHPEQTTHRPHPHGGRVSSLAWANCALLAWRQGRLADRDAVRAVSHVVGECLKRYGETDPVINDFFALVRHEGTNLERLFAAWTPFWLRLLADHPSTAPRGTPAAAASPATASEAQALADVRRAMDALLAA